MRGLQLAASQSGIYTIPRNGAGKISGKDGRSA